MVGQLLIDADAHVTEPADVWTSRVQKKYVDMVPHVVRNAEGKDVWLLDGTLIKTVGVTAPAGWPTYPADFPATFEQLHPGSYDAEERLKYLDSAGIFAQVLYPNVAGFGAQRFLTLPDEELKLECVRAYNDFLYEEWVSKSPERLIAIPSLPFWDVDASVAEIKRCADLGFRGILFTGEPQRFGLPFFGNSHWDPLYSIAQEAGLPIHFHIGGGEDTIAAEAIAARNADHGKAGSETYFAVDLFMKNGVQCVDLLGSGVLQRYPDLKFVSVESGVGWIPFALEAADYVYLGASKGASRIRGEDLLPSELFRRQVYGTYWFEKIAPVVLDGLLPDRKSTRLNSSHT